MCEKLVFIRLYSFLESVGFVYQFQSGFRPGDSTVMQLVFIVYKIHKALDRGNEVRAGCFFIFLRHLIRSGMLDF